MAASSSKPKRRVLDDSAMQELVDRFEQGESGRAIARSWNVDVGDLNRWLNATPERSQRYAHARARRAAHFAERINDVANEVLDGAVGYNEARVAIDAFKWTASRMDPKLFGDRVQVDAQVDVTVRPDDELRAAALALISKITGSCKSDTQS